MDFRLKKQCKLYPTVGLQTPGEVVDANFGQEPFRFDIGDMVEELRSITRASIYDNPIPNGDWSSAMHRWVLIIDMTRVHLSDF